MMLNLRLVLWAGVIWGVIGALLVVAAVFLGPLLPFSVDGLALGTYAAMFAGVHFVYRDMGNLLVGLVGGAVAGIIAALIMLVVSLLVPGTGFSISGSTGTIVGALAAGIAGALGMVIVKGSVRQKVG